MDFAKDSVRLDKKPDCELSECLFTDMINSVSINFDCPIVYVLAEPAKMTYRLQYSAAEHHSLLTAAIDRSIFLLAGSFFAGASSRLSSLVLLLLNNSIETGGEYIYICSLLPLTQLGKRGQGSEADIS